MLVELSAADQRYEAVNEVVHHNLPVTEVRQAERVGVSERAERPQIRRFVRRTIRFT